MFVTLWSRAVEIPVQSPLARLCGATQARTLPISRLYVLITAFTLDNVHRIRVVDPLSVFHEVFRHIDDITQ